MYFTYSSLDIICQQCTKHVFGIYQEYIKCIKRFCKSGVGLKHLCMCKTPWVSDNNFHLRTTGLEDPRFKLKQL